jgi:hypothetical protein
MKIDLGWDGRVYSGLNVGLERDWWQICVIVVMNLQVP